MYIVIVFGHTGTEKKAGPADRTEREVKMIVRVKEMLIAMFSEKAVDIALDLMDREWNTAEDSPADIANFKGIDEEEARRVYAVLVFLEDHEEVL